MAGPFYGNSNGCYCCNAVTFANYAAIFFPVLDQTLFTVGTSFVFRTKSIGYLQYNLLTYINTKGVESGKTVQLIFTSAKLIALFLIVLGLYVGLQTDVLSNNFANMWKPAKRS
jgi:APA family basic amino acid/polyamine antiporter